MSSQVPLSVAARAFAALDPLGRELTTAEKLHVAIYGERPDGGPADGVARAVATLRQLGHDVRLERHLSLPPRSRRPQLTSERHRRIVAAVEAGHRDVASIAEAIGVTAGVVTTELSRMRLRHRYAVVTTEGYRLVREVDLNELAA